MCRSIILLSKIAHQLWHDHPFSQRNRIKERARGGGWEGRMEATRKQGKEGGGWGGGGGVKKRGKTP